MIDPTGGWAKATEKSADAATEVIKTAREVGYSIGPAWQSLVGIVTDQLDVFRLTNRLRLCKTADTRVTPLIGQLTRYA
jgi:hypothetical protein